MTLVEFTSDKIVTFYICMAVLLLYSARVYYKTGQRGCLFYIAPYLILPYSEVRAVVALSLYMSIVTFALSDRN